MPRILDLFCCGGGAAAGYARAGFEVVGVDIDPQPRYPYEFHQADAIEFLRLYGHEFDAIHASPPCQAYTRARKLQGNQHPQLIEPTRELLRVLDSPYVIENVPGAPLVDPAVLCGAMFGLRTYRHRLFETNWPLAVPPHPAHMAKQTKMGRPPAHGEYLQIVGNFSGVPLAQEILGTPWMGQYEMAQCVPPAYTEYIGLQLRAHLMHARRVA